jgi:hypothetical protein
MESFNEERQRAKLAAGFKGGNMFEKPNLSPSLVFVDGVPSEIKAKFQGKDIPQQTPTNTWFTRRNK